MKKTDRNIILITCGGSGQRFGSDMPKQYLPLGDKMVVEHVIDACRHTNQAEAILAVALPEYQDLLRRYGIDVATGGETLNQSKRNGFNYIREHSSCEKLIVVDAVRPFIRGDVLDDIFRLLDDYDAVACARKITDCVGSYDAWRLDRERFYTLNAPEGFRFPLLDQNFDVDSKLTESIHHLPSTSKIYLKFDVPYFEKITYAEDLEKARALLEYRKRNTGRETL